MATVQEVRDMFNAKMSVLSGQITTIETQVEALFALVASGGADATALDALKTEIEAGFDALGTSVAKIGEDDPTV